MLPRKGQSQGLDHGAAYTAPDIEAKRRRWKGYGGWLARGAWIPRADRRCPGDSRGRFSARSVDLSLRGPVGVVSRHFDSSDILAEDSFKLLLEVL